MHRVSLSKMRRFFLPKLRCSPKKKRSFLKFERFFCPNEGVLQKKKVFTESETVFWQWCAQISRLFAQIIRPFARIFDDFRCFEPNGGGDRPPASYGYGFRGLGQSPSRKRGRGRSPQRSQILHLFCKNNLISELV